MVSHHRGPNVIWNNITWHLVAFTVLKAAFTLIIWLYPQNYCNSLMTWNKSYYKNEEAEELSVLKWHGKRKGSYPILRFWAQPAFCNMSHSPSLKVLGGWVMGRTLLMAEGGYPARAPFPRTQIMWFSIIFILLDQFLHLRGPCFHQLMKMPSETFLQGPVIPCGRYEGWTGSSICGPSTAILKSQNGYFTPL